MYINLKIFFEAEKIALLKRPFRLRRWIFVFFFTGLFWLMWLLVTIARGLDHIFYPGFRKQEVTRPVFVIAPPRSGTTFLQKLLCLDEERFSHLRLYHTIFPSVLLLRIIGTVGCLDRFVGRTFSRAVTWLERKAVGGWDNLHTLRLNAPEEDGGLFMYTLVTDSLYLLFPYVKDLPEPGFPDRLPERDRRRLMRYYRSCLQRHLYATGSNKTLLLKNTQVCGAIRSLAAEFPDGRIITPVRDPMQCVPSHVSLFYMFWQRHSPEIAKDSPESVAYGRLAVEWYEYLHAYLDTLPPDRYIRVPYEGLVENPFVTVESIYEHFGMELDGATRDRLAAACLEARRFRSPHKYTVEEYGLRREWIEDRLGHLSPLCRYGEGCEDRQDSLRMQVDPDDAASRGEDPL